MKTDVDNKDDMTTKKKSMDDMRPGDDNNETGMCVFKRGICQEHNIKGKKLTTKRQVWKKRKYNHIHMCDD